MSSTCPFILTKGNRKGEVCGQASKSEEIKYCRTHLRNLGVQKELLAQGIDPSGSTSQVSKPVTGAVKGVAPVNPKYNTPIIQIAPPTVKVVKEDKNNSFIKAFSATVDDEISRTADENKVDMNKLYDAVDAEEYDDEEAVEAIDNAETERLIIEQRMLIEKQREQILQQQRRITSMFTVKQLMYIGVDRAAYMIENTSESLEGYRTKVVTSPQINELLDEMTADAEAIIGFSEMPAWARLLGTMGILAVATSSEKSGLYVKEPRNIATVAPIPETLLPVEASVDYVPAYKE